MKARQWDTRKPIRVKSATCAAVASNVLARPNCSVKGLFRPNKSEGNDQDLKYQSHS
jgi:hypothetical protein